MKAVVHIHIGTDLPPYFWKTVAQTRRFFEGEIITIIPQECKNNKEISELDCKVISCQSFDNSPKIKELQQVSFLNKYGLGDFWHVTMQRLFVLEELMKRENLNEVIHLENDVTIYTDLEELFVKLKKVYTNSTAVVPLGPSEGCTAAFLYSDGVTSLEKVTARMIELLKLGEKNILKKLYRSQMVHEMMLLGIIHQEMPDTLSMLPILPIQLQLLPTDNRRVKPLFRGIAKLLDVLFPIKFNKLESFELNQNLEQLGGIFDPLSYGLYIGGHSNVHKDHGNPIIHKNHWVAPELLKGHYSVIWKKDTAGRKVPFLKENFGNKKEWKLFNIHVHNKKIEDFV